MNYNEWFVNNRDNIDKASTIIYDNFKIRINLDKLGRIIYRETEFYKDNVGLAKNRIDIVIDKKLVGYAKDVHFQKGGKLYTSADLFIYGFKRCKK